MAFRLTKYEDDCPHLPVERGRSGEGVGFWVPEVKHTYLAKFVEGTRRAREKFEQRVFIDPFCGPGRVQVKGEFSTRPGGAPVAWLHSRLDEITFTSCLIGDIDPTRVNACQARLSAMGAPCQSFIGPAAETSTAMLRAVPKRALCLVYLDPYNLQYLSFDIIGKLSRLPFVDFAVHFSTMDLRRNVLMEYAPERARFDEAAPGWRDHIDPAAFVRGDADEAFFDYWCSLVTGLGFSISHRIPLVRDDGNRPLYHLVFFSRHPLPNRIWSDVAQGKNREFDF